MKRGGVAGRYIVNKPTIAFGDVRAYRNAMPLVAIQAKAPDVVLKVSGVLARADAGVLKTIHVTPPKPVALFVRSNNHILGETFHSMAALRYGAYIAKLSAAPLSKSVSDLTDRPVEGALGDDALRDMVVDFFRSNSAEYQLCAQLCTDLEMMPVENASKQWPVTDLVEETARS